MQSVLLSKTIRERLPCGKTIYVTIATRPDNGKIAKILLTVGKSGQCHRALFEALQNVINLALENGGDYEDVIHALKGIRCEMPKLAVATSCVDFIARLLEENIRP